MAHLYYNYQIVNYKTDIKRVTKLYQTEKKKKQQVIVIHEQVLKGLGTSDISDETIIQVLCNIYGVDKYLIMAIVTQETGHFKSKAYLNYNNPGGLMYNGRLRQFDTLEQGYDFMIKNIKDN